MNLKTLFLRCALLILYTLLFIVDIGINKEIVIALCFVSFGFWVKRVIDLRSFEKQSIARFQGEVFHIHNIKTVLLHLGVLALMFLTLTKVDFSLSFIDVVPSVKLMYTLPFLPYSILSLFTPMRFYGYFFMPTGVLQTSDLYLFVWSDIEYYEIKLLNEEVQLLVKFYNEESLKLKPRKKDDVDIEGLIALLVENGVERKELELATNEE